VKKLLVVAFLCSLTLLSSCAGPPKAAVTNIRDLEVTPLPEEIIVVSDVGKGLGPKFGTAFKGKFQEFARPASKPLDIMTYMEFIRSPYNKPDVSNSFSSQLFVFVSTRSTNTDQYFVTSIEYLLEVKYLNKNPFLSQKIHLDTGNPYLNTDEERGAELARVIVEELKKRKIL
jgi:hypothetical protein